MQVIVACTGALSGRDPGVVLGQLSEVHRPCRPIEMRDGKSGCSEMDYGTARTVKNEHTGDTLRYHECSLGLRRKSCGRGYTLTCLNLRAPWSSVRGMWGEWTCHLRFVCWMRDLLERRPYHIPRRRGNGYIATVKSNAN